MFAAVMLIAPSRKYWGSALVCGLVLAVALHIVREIILFSWAGWPAYSGFDLDWIPELILFALPLSFVWRWYNGVLTRSRE